MVRLYAFRTFLYRRGYHVRCESGSWVSTLKDETVRLPTMTTQRWMAFFAVFAVTLTGWILYSRWVAAKVAGFFHDSRYRAGLPPGANPGDFIIEVPRDMTFWMDVDQFFQRFWIVLVVLAVLFSFVVAVMFPRGKAEAHDVAPPVRTQ